MPQTGLPDGIDYLVAEHMMAKQRLTVLHWPIQAGCSHHGKRLHWLRATLPIPAP
jgi:hypothetical protein